HSRDSLQRCGGGRIGDADSRQRRGPSGQDRQVQMRNHHTHHRDCDQTNQDESPHRLLRPRMPYPKKTKHETSRSGEQKLPYERHYEQGDDCGLETHDFFLLFRSSASIRAESLRSSALSITRWSTNPVSSSSKDPRQKFLMTVFTASAATFRGSRE